MLLTLKSLPSSFLNQVYHVEYTFGSQRPKTRWKSKTVNKTNKAKPATQNTIALNRKAKHNYALEERFELEIRTKGKSPMDILDAK